MENRKLNGRDKEGMALDKQQGKRGRMNDGGPRCRGRDGREGASRSDLKGAASVFVCVPFVVSPPHLR